MIVRAAKPLGALLMALLAARAAAPAEAATTTQQSPPAWPTDFLSRVEALALLQTLNAELLSNDSATQTLERWCTAHRLAANAKIVAERVRSPDEPPTANLLRELGASAGDSVRHRKVRLLCGSTVLSEEDNWYVPGRLTPAMNELLDTANLPFDEVVRELHFSRHTLSANLVSPPLPEGWELTSAKRPADPAIERVALRPVPPRVLMHRAVLKLPDGTPFSEVVESYTGNVLAFSWPTLPEIVVVARRPVL